MTRYIRWQGFLGFIAIVTLILGLLYIFAEPLAKVAIEKGTSQYTGAEVNVEQVTLSYAPLTITVADMQVTDPHKPTHNMASFEQATASVSLWPYLLGKTIIDDLKVSTLELNSERDSEGAVYVIPEENNDVDPLNDDWMASVEQNLPDPQTVLDDANLKTVKRAKAFKQSYQQESEKLKEIRQQLPDKEKLKEFQQKVKALTKTKVKNLQDIERIKREYDVLKKEFKQEQAKVKQAKEALLASKSELTTRLTELKNAPQEDWQDIEKKYQLEELDAQDFAHILFGEKARDYYQVAELTFKYLKPLLDQSAQEQAPELLLEQGRFIHFDEESPLPEFWLKQGVISVKLPHGMYEVELKDITHQHWMINKASQIALLADSKNKGDVSLNSTFAISASNEVTADGKWGFAQIPLNDVVLKDDEKLSLSLLNSLLGGQGKFDIADGQLALESLFALEESNFSGSANSKMGNILVDTLKNTKEFELTVAALGDLFSPEWNVSSPLNNLVGNAINQQVSAKLSSYKNKVQQGLNDKLSGSLELGQSQESELLDLEALFTDSDNLLDNLMKNDVVKQKQKELKDKAKDKLKDKLGKLFG